ncbi:DUF2809 domain-containing protein [Cetobacterium sp. 2A]|uniref:ribosomal maturation YjgA family protein n=1 Tax=Cetobacterium sp. 2A TaxID=2754723 RepID=UPI00163C4AFA|nr:DUF2809 domain-containing protein [Cetobacterium sp. 2A]MBC2857085.1 DUF2809 domain-containing protein [Cetobacterium sp. 2A]
MKKVKFIDFIVFLVIFMVELYIGLYVKDQYIRPYLGDILIIPLIYTFLNIFFKNNYRELILKIVIFAVCVELFQYFKMLNFLRITNKILQIVIGTTYDLNDIFCYVIGGFLTYLVIIIIKTRQKS